MPMLTRVGEGYAASQQRGLQKEQLQLQKNADQRAAESHGQQMKEGEQRLKAGEQALQTGALQQQGMEMEIDAQEALQVADFFHQVDLSEVDKRYDVRPGALEVFERANPWMPFAPNENITGYTRGADGGITFEVTEEIPTGGGPIRVSTRTIAARPDATQYQYDRHVGPGGRLYQVQRRENGQVVSVLDLNGNKVPLDKLPADFFLTTGERQKNRELDIDQGNLNLRRQQENRLSAGGTGGAGGSGGASGGMPPQGHRWDAGLPQGTRESQLKAAEDHMWSWLASAWQLAYEMDPESNGYGAPLPDQASRNATQSLDTFRYMVDVQGVHPDEARRYIQRETLAKTGVLQEEADVAERKHVPGPMPPRQPGVGENGGMDQNGRPAPAGGEYEQMDPATRQQYDALINQARRKEIDKPTLIARLKEIGVVVEDDTPSSAPPRTLPQ